MKKKRLFNSVPSLTPSFFVFVLQVRRRFCFSRGPSTARDPDNVTERPPEPLPIFPAENVPDDSYEDLDSLGRSQEGSAISLEWPSPYNEIRVRSTNNPLMIPSKERKSHEHPTLTTKNPLYVETITSSDQKLKGKWSPYDNLPPPLPERRKDADVYMSPLTLPQGTISGPSTPETSDTKCFDEHGYLKCVASNRFDLDKENSVLRTVAMQSLTS